MLIYHCHHNQSFSSKYPISVDNLDHSAESPILWLSPKYIPPPIAWYSSLIKLKVAGVIEIESSTARSPPPKGSGSSPSPPTTITFDFGFSIVCICVLCFNMFCCFKSSSSLDFVSGSPLCIRNRPQNSNVDLPIFRYSVLHPIIGLQIYDFIVGVIVFGLMGTSLF
ncbi:unnamed protein product [Lactuca saligna]|uniref:Transmembrane protein n=1 Tax=Lactuca saligna TaxID=75948 RepID=A0AA35ZSY9_LACSI|nr:unnamed protein product [Lactuca saligna]